jgi:hypothetical protein
MQKLESKAEPETSALELLQAGQLAECEARLGGVEQLSELMDLADYLKTNFSLDFRNIF